VCLNLRTCVVAMQRRFLCQALLDADEPPPRPITASSDQVSEPSQPFTASGRETSEPRLITASGKPLPESVWALKPFWCQPWTILLTGFLGPSVVWLISGKSVVWTTFASVPILAWWYLFLVLYPAEYAEYRKSFSQSGRRDVENMFE
jgi:hypothetical protein